MGWLTRIFDTSGFPPRWQCGPTWAEEPVWGWVHILADAAIWGAYMAIPIVLWSMVRRRHDLPFPRVIWLFGAFIFACGFGHLIDALMFTWPAYRFLGLVKLATAIVSWSTVVALIPILPTVLKLQSPRQLETIVQDRTHELQAVNKRLKAEVTRRELTERALRDREEQLRLVLEAGRMGTWEWDLSTGLCRIDEQEKRLLGVTALEGQVAVDTIFAAMHPDDMPRVRAATQRSIHQSEVYDEAFRMVRPDGKVVWLSGRGDVVRDEAGRPSRMIGVNFEITERLRADEALLLRDRALQSATNGIVITDAQELDLPIIFANRGFELLTGYSQEEILGKNCRFLQGPETDEATVHEIRTALANQTGCHVTVLNYRKDGQRFWNDVRITPLKNAQGEVTHYVGVQGDVTDRQEFEEALKRAKAGAQAASQAKSEFLANMSHEIRTPLTAVLGCADTLFPRLEVEEHRDMVQMIRNQGRVLLGILNDILDLSKIEAGRLELHAEPCSIVSVIEDVRSLLGPQAIEKGLELRTHYEGEMPVEMEIDPLRVRQILMNLVGNAIKFTDTGHVTIAARSDRTTDPPRIDIQVRDTGIGIPADRLEAVFEAFSQISGMAPSRKVGGTGLGLTISQRLVHKLDGQIDVQSEVGKGTTFTVSLPIRSSQPLRFEASAGLMQAADLQQKSRDSIDIVLPLTVLVAEDTRGIQFMIRRMLEDAGAMVAVVENGERAVAEVQRAAGSARPYDVVVMDMQMPVMNGFDATARLRALGQNLPIIALTAAAMQGDREKCLRAGCDDYLSKPVDRRALLDAITRQYNRTLTGSRSPNS